MFGFLTPAHVSDTHSISDKAPGSCQGKADTPSCGEPAAHSGVSACVGCPQTPIDSMNPRAGEMCKVRLCQSYQQTYMECLLCVPSDRTRPLPSQN